MNFAPVNIISRTVTTCADSGYGTLTVLVYIISLLFMMALSLAVSEILARVLDRDGYNVNKAIMHILSGVLSITLILRYGFSITALQGMFLFFVLVYASVSDLTFREVDDFVWVIVLSLALANITETGIFSMLVGAAAVFIIQIGTVLFSEKRAYGGADIKLSTSLAFLLGCTRGLLALILGLGTAVIFMMIYRKLRGTENKKAFPLVPFLSFGAMVMFLV